MSGIPDDEFSLTEGDKQSSLWLRLRSHLLDRLDRARRRNDDPNQAEQATAALRGEIRCLKAIIALGDDRPMTGEFDEAP
jgi:hypothetical protein